MAKRSLVPNLGAERLRICMFVSNDMLNDPRVARHAETLGLNGANVTVLCPLTNRTRLREARNGFEIRRVPNALSRFTKAFLDPRKQPSFERNSTGTSSSQPRVRLLARKRNLCWLRQVIFTLASMLTVQLTMMRDARRLNAHVYWANDLDTLHLAVFAAMFGRKVVYDSHELWPDMLLGVPEFVRTMLRSLEKWLVKRADFVITVNEFIAEVIESRYSLRAPVRVIYNTPKRTISRPLKQSRKRKYKVALYQGLYMPERGLENLVEAAKHLHPDVRLVFRGYGILEGRLRSLSSAFSNVRFEEAVPMEKMIEAAASADLGVVAYVPSNLCNYLASPNKLFEYIQAGIPIASSDIPFMRLMVLRKGIGVVFDPHDPVDIANALNRATRETELSRYRRNLIPVAQEYCWENESKKLLDIYEALKT